MGNAFDRWNGGWQLVSASADDSVTGQRRKVADKGLSRPRFVTNAPFVLDVH